MPTEANNVVPPRERIWEHDFYRYISIAISQERSGNYAGATASATIALAFATAKVDMVDPITANSIRHGFID